MRLFQPLPWPGYGHQVDIFSADTAPISASAKPRHYLNGDLL